MSIHGRFVGRLYLVSSHHAIVGHRTGWIQPHHRLGSHAPALSSATEQRSVSLRHNHVLLDRAYVASCLIKIYGLLYVSFFDYGEVGMVLCGQTSVRVISSLVKS